MLGPPTTAPRRKAYLVGWGVGRWVVDPEIGREGWEAVEVSQQERVITFHDNGGRQKN